MWTVRPAPPLLQAHEVHLWRFDLDSDPEAAARGHEILSHTEQARAERLLIPAVRARFVAGRVMLRRMLAAYLGISAKAVRLTVGAGGKPLVHGLHFNLSHSDWLATLAVARVPVGVDVERIRPVDAISQVAATVFTPPEIAALDGLHGDDKLLLFFRLWTRKESVMKAHGGGMKRAHTFTVSAGDPPAVSGEPGWTLRDFVPAAGFAAAVCAQSGAFSTVYLQSTTRFPESTS